MNKANILAIKAWVYFTFNYYDPKDFIRYICDRNGRPDLEKHFLDSFNEIYERVGSKAVMNVFYCYLSPTNQEALVEYAIKVYAPNGLYLTEEDRKLLGL